MDKRNTQALKELGALLKAGGALRIITSKHDCGGGWTPSKAKELKACETYKFPRTHPAHYLIHDVVRLVVRPKGQVRAWTNEGDYMDGEPAAVLARLLQVNQQEARDAEEAEAKRLAEELNAQEEAEED